MNQKRLLQVALLSAIVTVAALVVMKLSAEPAHNTSEEEIRQALITIAVRAQAWYHRSPKYGGGGGSFAGITFDKIDFDPKSIPAKFSITVLKKNKFRVTGAMIDGRKWSTSLEVYPNQIEPVPGAGYQQAATY